MPNSYERILEILEMESMLYEKLYEIAGEKKDIIIDEEMDKLAEIVKKEEQLLAEIKKLEEERSPLEAELPVAEDESQRKLMIDLKAQLEEIASKLKDRNLLNKKLIDNSLSLINIDLNLLKDSGGKKIYSKKGLVDQQASAFINKKA